MYKKDLTHRITVRLNDDMNKGLEEMASFYGISPSDMIRQLISTNVNTHRVMLASIDTSIGKAMNGVETSDKVIKRVNSSDKNAKPRQTKTKK